MSKKHFIALADTMRLKGMMPASVSSAIHRACPELTDGQKMHLEQEVLGAVAQELADFCIEQNGRFDRYRWLDYIAGECGPNGGKVGK